MTFNVESFFHIPIIRVTGHFCLIRMDDAFSYKMFYAFLPSLLRKNDN